jgi:hypothetical protein
MLDKEILANFGRIWPAHVASLTEFLIDCRRQFGGDLDLLLVLCIIGDRTYPQRHARTDLNFEVWRSGRIDGVPVEDVNAQSISDYCSIPRETVRRKLKTLLAKNWIRVDADGYYSATEQAKHELEPLTLTTLEYLSRMRALFNSISPT